MDGLELVKTFREVAVRRSFSRAAVSLGIAKSTVSKHIATLETNSGVRLLNRSTTAFSLTAAGELLLTRSADIVELADRTLRDLQDYGAIAKGRLRLCAPHAISAGWLPQVLGEFMSRCPAVHVVLESRNDVPDLIAEGIDIWIGPGAIKDENLIARPLFNYQMVLCASPRYWERAGLPMRPEELRRHPLLGFSHPFDTPVVFNVEGRRQEMSLEIKMETNDASTLLELAARGSGLTYVPEPLASPYLGRAALVPVLQEYVQDERWICASYAQRHHNSAAMRLMLDFLKEKAGSGAA